MNNIFYILIFSIWFNNAVSQISLAHVEKKNIADIDQLYFNIADSIEPNSFDKTQLSSYLYKCFVNNDVKTHFTDSIYTRKSFVKVIYLLFSNPQINENLNHYENINQWNELLPDLISNCTNITVKYRLLDTLLVSNHFNSIEGVWLDFDESRLNNIQSIWQNVLMQNDCYLLSKLIIISHNSNRTCIRDMLRDMLQKSTCKKLHYKIETLLKNKVVFYIDYVEAIYGGI